MDLSIFELNSPFDELRRMQREVDRLFNNALTESNTGTPSKWSPKSDLKETENSIVLHCELPGVKKEDINIELKNGILTVSGEKKQEKKEEKDKYYRIERSYGHFSRSLAVPDGVKEDQIQASLKDGVLEVSFPKPVQKKPEVKKITIQ